MAAETTRSVGARLVRLRHWVQGAALLVWLDPLGLRLHGFCGAVFQCHSCPLATFACPIGVLAHATALHVIPLAAIGTLVLVGALLGTLVCGWLCPFGFLQDLIGKVPLPKFQLPRAAGYFRYVVLIALVLAIPYFFGEGHPLLICSVCPAGALEGAVPNMVGAALTGRAVEWPNVLKVIVTVLVVTAMLFTYRPWCRLFCPLGAIYGLFNGVSAVFLRFRRDRCIACGLCSEPCRYGVVTAERANDPRCIRCLECTRCGAFTLDTVLSGEARGADHPPKGRPGADAAGPGRQPAGT